MYIEGGSRQSPGPVKPILFSRSLRVRRSSVSYKGIAYSNVAYSSVTRKSCT